MMKEERWGARAKWKTWLALLANGAHFLFLFLEANNIKFLIKNRNSFFYCCAFLILSHASEQNFVRAFVHSSVWHHWRLFQKAFSCTFLLLILFFFSRFISSSPSSGCSDKKSKHLFKRRMRPNWWVWNPQDDKNILGWMEKFPSQWNHRLLEDWKLYRWSEEKTFNNRPKLWLSFAQISISSFRHNWVSCPHFHLIFFSRSP